MYLRVPRGVDVVLHEHEREAIVSEMRGQFHEAPGTVPLRHCLSPSRAAAVA